MDYLVQWKEETAKYIGDQLAERVEYEGNSLDELLEDSFYDLLNDVLHEDIYETTSNTCWKLLESLITNYDFWYFEDIVSTYGITPKNLDDVTWLGMQDWLDEYSNEIKESAKAQALKRLEKGTFKQA